jgi:glucose/arabinose dehydrogenase
LTRHETAGQALHVPYRSLLARRSSRVTTRRARVALGTVLLVVLVGADLFAAGPSAAATLPAGFSETIVASGLSNPTAMAFAPDGRLFVAEQGGALRVIKNGSLLATPFLTVTVDANGERGLLGVAFDPNFATNQYVYVYYTSPTPSTHNRISRFTANGDVAQAGSETVILELNNLSSATNHNGGAIHFGPDGKLYVGVGENANSANSQSLSNLLGKILRLNADGTIPTDNPFFNTANGVNRLIWALGLRNPFTFAFQPGTGRLFIDDVGQSTWEEIDDGTAGANYGWPTSEGPDNTAGFTAPLYWYGHGSTSTTGCAITGGTFYNPAIVNFPAGYVGKYFFADYCSGWIRLLDPATATATDFATGTSSPVDLQVDSSGRLYYLARGGGVVGRIQYTASQAPVITQHPSDLTVSVGAPATFSVAASGTAPLSYQWQRNGSDIGGANSSSYTLPSATTANNGDEFRCRVSNSFGNATSNAATLTVTSNTPPTATITAPTAGSFYSAGQTITYAGTGTDTQDGSEPASRFTWQIDFWHDDGNLHSHPVMAATSGSTGGSFTIPTSGETSVNVWYRITLTVADSGGLTSTVYVDIVPRVVTITLNASPAGLQLTVDGQPHAANYSFQSVVGMLRSIGAPSPQTIAGVSYWFSAWSDRGKATHTIATPATNTTYTVTFKVKGKR